MCAEILLHAPTCLRGLVSLGVCVSHSLVTAHLIKRIDVLGCDPPPLLTHTHITQHTARLAQSETPDLLNSMLSEVSGEDDLQNLIDEMTSSDTSGSPGDRGGAISPFFACWPQYDPLKDAQHSSVGVDLSEPDGNAAVVMSGVQPLDIHRDVQMSMSPDTHIHGFFFSDQVCCCPITQNPCPARIPSVHAATVGSTICHAVTQIADLVRGHPSHSPMATTVLVSTM